MTETDIKVLLVTWQKEYLELVQLSKQHKESKASLEQLKRSFENEYDAILENTIENLTLYVNKLHDKYTKKAEVVEEITAQIKETKSKILSTLHDHLQTLRDINTCLDNNTSYHVDSVESELITQGAKVLYKSDHDNHDLRLEPPICGSVFKNEYRSADIVNTESTNNWTESFKPIIIGDSNITCEIEVECEQVENKSKQVEKSKPFAFDIKDDSKDVSKDNTKKDNDNLLGFFQKVTKFK